MSTADLLRLAEILDGAGFAYLEVSGGGVFDNAVRRGVESPWERIRALKSRTKTPLALAAAPLLLNAPAAVLPPHRAGELVAELREISGLPVGLYAQGASGNALAAALEAARAGADVIAAAVYPVALTMHRVSAESVA